MPRHGSRACHLGRGPGPPTTPHRIGPLKPRQADDDDPLFRSGYVPRLKLQFVRTSTAALPFLAAVAVDAVPSREEDVYRGLARLEVEVCNDLVGAMSSTKSNREKGEAVAFIAVRQEHEGIVRRNIGTAHLELDVVQAGLTGMSSDRCSQGLSVPAHQGDAFSLLLSGSPTSRKEYLRLWLIPTNYSRRPRIRLTHPPHEEDLADLIGDLEEKATSFEDDANAPDDQEGSNQATPEEPSSADGGGDAAALWMNASHQSTTTGWLPLRTRDVVDKGT